jgi:hypothetical protein
MCPDCNTVLESTTYVDYCPNCGWEYVYPSVETARPGTLTETDRAAADRNGAEAQERP